MKINIDAKYVIWAMCVCIALAPFYPIMQTAGIVLAFVLLGVYTIVALFGVLLMFAPRIKTSLPSGRRPNIWNTAWASFKNGLPLIAGVIYLKYFGVEYFANLVLISVGVGFAISILLIVSFSHLIKG